MTIKVQHCILQPIICKKQVIFTASKEHLNASKTPVQTRHKIIDKSLPISLIGGRCQNEKVA